MLSSANVRISLNGPSPTPVLSASFATNRTVTFFLFVRKSSGKRASYSCREPFTTSRATSVSAMAAKTCRKPSPTSAPISMTTLDFTASKTQGGELLQKQMSAKQNARQIKQSVPPGAFTRATFFLLTSNLQLLKLRCAHCPSLLEAFPAKHRPPLRGPERNGSFLPALRAIGLRLRTGLHRVPAASATLCSFCLARFTSFWFVLESLVSEKHLLAGSEHELRTTFG